MSEVRFFHRPPDNVFMRSSKIAEHIGPNGAIWKDNSEEIIDVKESDEHLLPIIRRSAYQ
jgi:hypothetical protein